MVRGCVGVCAVIPDYKILSCEECVPESEEGRGAEGGGGNMIG